MIARLTAFLEAPVDPLVATFFRRALLLKLFAFHLAHHVAGLAAPRQLVLTGLLALATVAGFTTRFARVGLAAWLAFAWWDVAHDFPWTPNHHYLEAILLFALVVIDAPAGRGVRVCGAAILVVFFFAGIQKIYQGRWLNGEYLAHTVLFAPPGNGLAFAIRKTFGGIASFAGLAPLPLPSPTSFAFTREAIELPRWAVSGLRGMSWTTVAAEVLLPVLACIRRTRTLALGGLLLSQSVFAGCAGIWSFGITGTACLLLSFPARARLAFPALMLSTVVLAGIGAAGAARPFLPFDWF